VSAPQQAAIQQQEEGSGAGASSSARACQVREVWAVLVKQVRPKTTRKYLYLFVYGTTIRYFCRDMDTDVGFYNLKLFCEI
jgi:hypothetical protein